MGVDGSRAFRERVYSSYLSGSRAGVTPQSVEDLQPRIPYLNRLVRRHFPVKRNAEILELGCGHGALLYILQENGYRNARGIDVSSEQVAAARELGVATVQESEVMSALRSTPEGALDVVVAFDLLEHFTRDEAFELADHVHRVLKPGGRWIIHVPNGESPFVGAIRYGDLTHEIAYTSNSLTQLAMASRFRDVTCFEDVPTVHGGISAARWLMWRGLRSLLRLYMAVETGDVVTKKILSQNMLAIATR